MNVLEALLNGRAEEHEDRPRLSALHLSGGRVALLVSTGRERSGRDPQLLLRRAEAPGCSVTPRGVLAGPGILAG